MTYLSESAGFYGFPLKIKNIVKSIASLSKLNGSHFEINTQVRCLAKSNISRCWKYLISFKFCIKFVSIGSQN